MRKLPLLFGCILVLFASARILVEMNILDNPRLEGFVCRFLPCSEDLPLERAAAQLERGGVDGLAQAVTNFEEALRRNPASAGRWCDLGEALLESGQTERARRCFLRAMELSVNSTPMMWRTAQFYFRVKENKTALQYMSRILSKGPDYEPAVFEAYVHSDATILDILNYGMPEGPRAVQSYFRHLLRSGEARGLEEAWNWITQRSLAGDPLAGQYVNSLLEKKRFDAALEAWTRYLGDRRGAYQQSDFLYNGDFEFEFSGSSFDWVVRNLEGVEVARDPAVSCSGNSSLRIHFEGKENLSYDHISQLAVVRPGSHLFLAQVRAEGITTDQGIGFRIFDAESSARLDVRIENLVGTSGWKKVETRFVVPQETKLIQVRVVRQSSWKFDNKISGTAWIDGVTLVRLAP